MKTYNVYHHPSGVTEAVKVGWSWPAFFFALIWALIKKLWKIAAILWGVMIVLSVLNVLFDSDGTHLGLQLIISIISLSIYIIAGKNGNSWRESNLVKQGYNLATSITATSPSAALAEYRKRLTDSPIDNLQA